MSVKTNVEKNKNIPFFVISFCVLLLGVSIVFALFTRTPRSDMKTAVGNSLLFPAEQQLPDKSSRASFQIEVSGGDPSLTALVKKVADHIALPGGNITVATVLKPEELRKENPVFYQNAREGDKVLIYSDRAILYNPEIDRVIDVVHFVPQAGQTK